MTKNANNTVSIVVVSNPLSVLLANKILFDYSPSNINILIIDHGKRKESFLNEILDAAKKQSWSKIINLSEKVNNESNSKPSFVKKITRKYKTMPVIKSFHSILQKKLLANIEAEIESTLTPILTEFTQVNKVNLYLLAQTYSNNCLHKLFPTAHINYYEHGIGDYALAAKAGKLRPGNFYGIFANEYREFDTKSGLNYISIDFGKKINTGIKDLEIERNSVLVILQNLEIYNLGLEFWKSYFMDIAKNTHAGSTFLIKPHPLQSNEILEFIDSFFKMQNLTYKVLPFSKSIEVEFEEIEPMLKAVYSPFSSSIYYLSKLNYKVTFYHSIERIKSLVGNAPVQYRNHFIANYEIVKKVFGLGCKDF